MKGALRQLAQIVQRRAMSNSSAGNVVRSTAASGSQVYDTARAVNEYLLFHYGDQEQFPYLQMPFGCGPTNALQFCERSAIICERFSNGKERALDLGCSVGGASFQLAKNFNEVVGLDFSQHFIDAANEMKAKRAKSFEILQQGKIMISGVARLELDLRTDNVTFVQGDACSLNSSLGQFDVILGSNLLCRLPKPRKFLSSVPRFLSKDGVLVLISPYSWLEEYTPVEEWVGGTVDAVSGQPVESFVALRDHIESEGQLEFVHEEEVPFLIREHQRKYQFGVSHCTVWQKK